MYECGYGRVKWVCARRAEVCSREAPAAQRPQWHIHPSPCHIFGPIYARPADMRNYPGVVRAPPAASSTNASPPLPTLTFTFHPPHLFIHLATLHHTAPRDSDVRSQQSLITPREPTILNGLFGFILPAACNGFYGYGRFASGVFRGWLFNLSALDRP